jgi:hypothetical protein
MSSFWEANVVLSGAAKPRREQQLVQVSRFAAVKFGNRSLSFAKIQLWQKG